jgi:hypothetical protein
MHGWAKVCETCASVGDGGLEGWEASRPAMKFFLAPKRARKAVTENHGVPGSSPGPATFSVTRDEKKLTVELKALSC